MTLKTRILLIESHYQAIIKIIRRRVCLTEDFAKDGDLLAIKARN